jgi:hypothetical protein
MLRPLSARSSQLPFRHPIQTAPSVSPFKNPSSQRNFFRFSSSSLLTVSKGCALRFALRRGPVFRSL